MRVGCSGTKLLFLGDAKIPPPLTLKPDTWYMISYIGRVSSQRHSACFYYFIDKYGRKVIRADRDAHLYDHDSVVIDKGDFAGTIGITTGTAGTSTAGNRRIVSVREIGKVLQEELQDDSNLRN